MTKTPQKPTTPNTMKKSLLIFFLIIIASQCFASGATCAPSPELVSSIACGISSLGTAASISAIAYGATQSTVEIVSCGFCGACLCGTAAICSATILANKPTLQHPGEIVVIKSPGQLQMRRVLPLSSSEEYKD